MHSTKVVWIDGSRQEETTVLHAVRRYVYWAASNQPSDNPFQGVSDDASPSDEPSASSSNTTPQPATI
jgi:hypothetical protein